MDSPGETCLQAWEGVHPLPDVHPPQCSWCRRPGDAFFVVIFAVDLPAVSVVIQADAACGECAKAGEEYISLRKQGVRRKDTLRDLGIRE